MTRRIRVLTLVVAASAASPALAIDSPHDGSFTEGLCQTCHKLHAGSGTLTNQPDNNTTCTACHNKQIGSLRGFPWLSDRQAQPGTSGDQHSWTALADSAAHSARTPLDAEMLKRVDAGRLQCSTCHDQHAANGANAPGSMHASIPIGGTGVDETGNVTGNRGTAKMILNAPGGAAAVMGYRLKVVTVATGVGGSFVISHDFGMATPSWFNWNGSGWEPGSATGTGKPFSVDADVTLDDPAVSVRFTAGANVGDYWDFAISFPFLRATNVNDAMCQDCHRDRVMSHACVEGEGACAADGTRLYSHPVNETLNANAQNYDRTPANPDPLAQALLDANGDPQSAGDGIRTNDLKLVPGADLASGTADDAVGCTTCHAPHNSDSNSLTEDAR